MYSTQHHHAHICSLMGDNMMNLESEIIGIALDGVGYGPDGTIWGGEIIRSSYHEYKRLGHLKLQPMIGGDASSYNIKKMLLGILSTIDNKEIYDSPIITKKFSNMEKNITSKQIKNNFNIIYTSSMGRILDSISCLFDICNIRTYDGEPSMKLESYIY